MPLAVDIFKYLVKGPQSLGKNTAALTVLDQGMVKVTDE